MAAPSYNYDLDSKKNNVQDIIDEMDDDENNEDILSFVNDEILKNPKFWKDFMTYFAIPFIQGAFYGLGEFVAHAAVVKYGFLKKSYNQLPEKKNKFYVNRRNQTEPVAVAMGVDKGIYEQLVFQTVMEKSSKMMTKDNQSQKVQTQNPKIMKKEEISGLKDLINTENKNNLIIKRTFLF